MKRAGSSVAASVTAVLISIIPTSGCTVANPQCDCAAPNISLHVPSTQVQPSNTLVASGAGCQGATATCTQKSGNGCLTFSIAPIASGNCHIDLTLPTHTFTTDIMIKRATGCCAGLYPDPVGAGEVQVTSLR